MIFFSILTNFLYFSSGQCGWTNVIHTNLLQHLSTALQNRLFHFLSAPAANSFGNINQLINQLPLCSVTLRTASLRNGAWICVLKNSDCSWSFKELNFCFNVLGKNLSGYSSYDLSCRMCCLTLYGHNRAKYPGVKHISSSDVCDCFNVGIKNISRKSARKALSTWISGLDDHLMTFFQIDRCESELERRAIIFFARLRQGVSYCAYHWRWLCRYSHLVSTHIWGNGGSLSSNPRIVYMNW